MTTGRAALQRFLQPVAAGALLLFALFAMPSIFDATWIFNFTQMAIYSMVAASVGMLYGRVGLVSLGQVAPYGIGAWVTIRLAFATDLPYPLLLVIGGGAAAVIGVLIGLPALRVSGLYLALVTLMLAVGVEVVLFRLKFPNGGPGFNGLALTMSDRAPVPRPGFAQGDTAYFRFVVIVAFVVFMLAVAFLASKPGRAWASIHQSEPSALASGISITRYKLMAFGLAAFMAGVAGGLFGAHVQWSIGVDQFNRQAALFLVAVVLMGGINSLWGALLAAFFAKILLDFLTQNVIGHQFWNDFALTIFGIGLMINLISTTRAMDRKGLLE
ncbi:branched-chain amino acid ABC transporter permease [Candidatus Poriferisodalis sp.]|uniref:branched-chain amino acid ABC transporter permease n=1 Tax=Candidatus Poriferisodalis sp. TaxID=3101277 RepID=UPI003B01FE24